MPASLCQPRGLPISEQSLNADADYSIQAWTSDNGLKKNHVYNILQTQDGFIWLVFENSITRFDGKNFKDYNAGNTKGFPEHGFRCLFEDAQGTLWILCDTAILKFRNGRITPYYSPLEKEQFTTACQGPGGALLLSTERGNVYAFKDGRFSLFCSAPKQFIICLLFKSPGILYIGTKDSGLYHYTGRRLAHVEMPGKVQIQSIRRHDDSSIYVAGFYNLYRIYGDVISEVPINKVVDAKKDQLMLDYLVDHNETWIATRKGVARLKGEQCTYLTVDVGLSSNEVSRIFKDRENNTWFCTVNGGLNKLRKKIIRSYSETEHYEGSSAGAVIRGPGHSILVANYCYGAYEMKNGRFSPVAAGGCVWTMLMEHDGTLWTGCYGNGIFTQKNGKISQLDISKQLPSLNVFALFKAPDSTVWIGTSKGLCSYRHGALKVYKEINYEVSQVSQDQSGNTWFCSTNGLGTLVNGKTTLYTIKDGLPSNHVRYMYEDREHTRWIATYGGGLVRMKDGHIFSFNRSPALIDLHASCIMEDEQGRLWISTNNGIYSVNKNELNNYADGKSPFLTSKYHGREAGMKYTECNGGFQSPGLKLDDGRFVFPTVNGIVFLDPSMEESADEPSDLLIEKIESNGREFPASDSVITLPKGTTNLSVQICSPFFSQAKNLFQYKLEKVDADWSEPTSSWMVRYNALVPGTYVFKARLYGSSNTLLNKEKQVTFVIPEAFWQTPLFLWLAIGLAILLFLVILVIRIRMLRRNLKQRNEIKRNYALLELKALQAQMNPHFIFNCLNTIKFFITSQDNKAANKYLGKFSSLIRLFLSNSRNNFISLSTEIELLELYVELEQLRLDHGFTTKFHVDQDLDTQSIIIPGMLFQPFVENAIHHGLRPSNRARVLTVSFSRQNGSIVGTVDDNGVGRSHSHKKEAGENRHISLGIRSIEERIATINYIENIHITLQVIDKLDAGGAPAGTRVVITIPVKDDN